MLAPDFILDVAIAQLAKLRGSDPAMSTLVVALGQKAQAAGLSGDWRGRAAALLTQRVYPAIERQHRLVLELRRDAHPEAGIGG